jgi:hypothetical protein
VYEQRYGGMVVKGAGSYSHPREGGDGTSARERFLARFRKTGTGPPRATNLMANQVAGLRRATGMTDSQLANAMRGFIRTGTLPPALAPHSTEIGRMTLLMFGRESARSVGNVALAPMTLELIGSGKMSFHEATRGNEGYHVPTGAAGAGGAGAGSSPGGWRPQGGAEGWGGSYPMSMQGAPAAAEELERERRALARGDTPRPRSEGAQELARREIAVAQRWLRMQMQAAGLYGFASRDEALEFITHRLLEFYRMRMVEMSTLAPHRTE